MPQAVEVVGLKELRRELRRLDDPRGWTKQLTAVNRGLGRQGAQWAQGAAGGMGGVQAHFAGSIRGYGNASGARIGVAGKANAAFWGAKQRTGWNARNQTANQPEWVGAGWEVAVAGQGPYAINSALAAHVDDIVDLYAEGIDDLTRRAFPD